MKKVLSIVLVLAMLLSLVACAGSDNPAAEGSSDAVTGENDSGADDQTKSPESADTSEIRTVTGDDGVEVEIPYTITKAAPLIGAFTQMTEMLTSGGGKIAAAATENISDYFKEVFPDYVESNPNDYDSTTVEDLIAAGAQVCYGPSSIFSEDQLAQLNEAGIAYVAINNFGTVSDISNAFLIIGEILGEEEYVRAQEFVDYYQENIDLCAERTAEIAEEDKVKFLSLFYSADAYTTINSGDICSEYVKAVGAVNAAADYMISSGSSNKLTVDTEQIVEWNPQFIMVNSQEGKEAILNAPALATVDAIKNDNVQVCPYGVYMWSVRSGEGGMLPLWLGVQMYPELFSDIDMEKVVREFFNDWYNYDISDEEIKNTLSGS